MIPPSPQPPSVAIDDQREAGRTRFRRTRFRRTRFRRTLVRVLSVQVVTLVLLWVLQMHYTLAR